MYKKYQLLIIKAIKKNIILYTQAQNERAKVLRFIPFVVDIEDKS